MNNTRLSLSNEDLKALALDYKARSERDAEAGHFIFYSDRRHRLLNQCGVHFFQALEKEIASEAILFFAEAGEPSDIDETLRSHRIDKLGRSIIQSFQCILKERCRDISPADTSTIDRVITSFCHFIDTDLQSNHMHNNMRYPRLVPLCQNGPIHRWESVEFSEHEIEEMKTRIARFRTWSSQLWKLAESMTH